MANALGTCYANRGWKYLFWLVFAVGVLSFVIILFSPKFLVSPQFMSGIILTILILLQFIFPLLKKLNYRGKYISKFWQDSHRYLGLLALALFGYHVLPLAPTSGFRWFLFGWTTLTFLTGLLGWFWYWSVPKILAGYAREYDLAEYANERQQYLSQAKVLIAEHPDLIQEQSFKEFIDTQYLPFIEQPKDFINTVLNLPTSFSKLKQGSNSFARFFTSETNQHNYAQLTQILLDKHKLDRAMAWQKLLRYWLLVHIPLSVGLVLLMWLHIIPSLNLGLR